MTIADQDQELLEQMGTGVMPLLPDEVYADRFARCRALMAEQDLAALIVYSGAMPFQAVEWARYFANFVHPYWNSEAFIVIPADGEPALLVNYGFMIEALQGAGGPITDIRSPVERFGNASRYAGLEDSLREILTDRGISDEKVGVCLSGGQGDFSPAPLGPILASLLGDRQVEAHPLLTKLILKKSKFDLEMMRKVSALISDGMVAAFEATQEGGREYDAYLAFQEAVLLGGADSPIFHYISQSGPSAKIALRPLAATGRILQRQDLLLIDAGICYQGYYADITRTAAVGELSEDARKLYDATQEVVDSMVAELGPGVRAGRIAEILMDGIEQRGYTRTHPLIGHGIGTFINEPPFVMPWQDFVIEQDMVINLEPAIYDPNVGGVRIEDPYLITADGAERLTTIAQECWVA